MVITKYCTVSFAHSIIVETIKSTAKLISLFLNYNFKKKMFWTTFVSFPGNLPIAPFTFTFCTT